MDSEEGFFQRCARILPPKIYGEKAMKDRQRLRQQGKINWWLRGPRHMHQIKKDMQRKGAEWLAKKNGTTVEQEMEGGLEAWRANRWL